MKKALLVITVLTMVLAFGISSFASNVERPADVISRLTGLPLEDVLELRGYGKFSELAAEAGMLDAFKREMLDVRRAMVLHGVSNGRLSQEQADLIMDAFLAKIDNCDGEKVVLSQYELALARRFGQIAERIRGKR